MPYSTCEDDIKRILTELPSESNCIDYKLEPYETMSFPEFIRDAIAFLNCEESLFDDRYIIFGVEETSNQRKLIGLNTINKIMPDDAIFQSLVRKIRPLPIVHCGTINYQGMTFGYIHILKENTDRTYEVAEEYPQTRRQIDGISYKPTNSVQVGQAFIRRGTAKNIMDQHERRRLESQVYYKQSYDSSLSRIPSVNSKKSSLSVNLVAALVGVWNNNYDGDKEVIERLSNMAYDDWECDFQKRIAEGSDQITYTQGQWTFLNHIEIITSNARAYFDSHLAEYFSCFSDIVNTNDSKFELPSESRQIVISNIPTGKYSSGFREAIILSFTNIATQESLFTSCTKSFIKNHTYTIISKLILEGSWQAFATLNWHFRILSQSSPNAFLDSLTKVLKRPDNAVVQLINEGESGIFPAKYYHGLVAAIQSLTWCASYFYIASEILFSLTRISKEIEDSFVAVFLPWHPQTEALVSTRVGVIKHLVLEYGSDCWNVLFKLMPRRTSTGHSIEPPEFIHVKCEREEVLRSEFWSISEQYLDELIEITSNNIDSCAKLVDLLGDVNRPMFVKILAHLSSVAVQLECDADKFIIWDKLLSFTDKHRCFSDAKWALTEEKLSEIDSVVEIMKPRNIDIVESRLFKKEQYDLLRFNKDRQEGEDELQIHQTETIKRILNERKIQGVFQFTKMIGSPQVVGYVLASLILDEANEECILEQLASDNQNLSILAKSYCNTKHKFTSGSWLSNVDIMAMSKKKRIMLLSSIYICKEVLDLLLTLPPTEQNEYWTHASQRADESGLTSQTVEGLVGADKFEQSLEVLTRMIDKAQFNSPDLAYYVLDANLKASTERSQMWSYYINRVFKWLQKDSTPDNLEKLSHYEWAYYPVLSHEGKANALEYKLSSSPEIFLSVLSLVYKSDKELNDENTLEDVNEVKKNLSHNAWSVLYNWRWIPGKQLDGYFDPEAFTSWIDSVKSLSAQEGRYDIAMQNIGHVLYYAPESQDGFFIHKAVAATLDKQENEHIRRGYKVEAFNARGVYNYDPSGQQEDELARLWIKRAESAESLGYALFGKALRDIAHDFLNQKEHY